ncbi:DUF2750 domain-containing protein [Leptospira sp. 201903074]|uniref:DUF2750 domain-containing protein n=1 Tax=Leptospira abararensis TaxID=2810036 RepID=UPI001965B417|nr:DUF2750 domain-containing protein [Leptospira abararensis]MBM9547444.1 DUF2750 domain-containing protein [Leptospira abararensis]
MSKDISQNEIDKVIKLEPTKRLKYSISKIIDQAELWSLKNKDGFVGMGDEYGNNGIPFWPHIVYANKFITDDWSDCKPEKVNLYDFIENWIPEMIKENTQVIVFPTLEMKGIPLHPETILKALLAEKNRVE